MQTTTIDLESDARAEAARIEAARAVSRGDDETVRLHAESEGPWVTRAHGGRLRRSIGGRVLLIWRFAYEDSSGRTVASRLVGASVDVTPSVNRSRFRQWIRALIKEANARLPAQLDAANQTWHDSVSEACRSFASARVHRRRAIAARAANAAATRSEFQPGLFDRRAERSHRAQAAIRGNDHASSSPVETATTRGGAVVRRPPELLLVLAG